MNARENALVQKYALSFVEKVSDSSEIWNMYDQIFELITIIHDSKLNRLLLSATVSREEKAAFVRTVRQSSYWQINDLIEDLSTVFTLEAGDIITTGTPAGVGAGRNPQEWLKDGDVVKYLVREASFVENLIREKTVE